jgi:hypothetical protein
MSGLCLPCLERLMTIAAGSGPSGLISIGAWFALIATGVLEWT